jgi:hypothetical protein
MSGMFSNVIVMSALALVVALLITSFVILHGSTTQNATPDMWPSLNDRGMPKGMFSY